MGCFQLSFLNIKSTEQYYSRRFSLKFKTKMFKQEDFMLSHGDFSPPDSNIRIDENFMLNASPPFNDININDLVRLPLNYSEDLGANLLPLSPPAPQHSEETMDVAKIEFVEFPVSPCGPPERRVFAGDADFQVEINSTDTHRRKYLYSSQLNRIYVDMKCNFPVSFRWAAARAPSPAYVRACVVFSDESQAEKRVERCTQHTHETTNSTLNQAIVKNVLHSAREIGTSGVYYCGQPDIADSWYSVLVQIGSSGFGTHAYQFVCKNSCSSGINRRAIDVIYTLEDEAGHVYGRQSVGARVCACPRRDMLRDEETEGVFKTGKRRVQCNRVDNANSPSNGSKKIKLETRVEVADNDDSLITLPSLDIVGTRPVITGLEVMLSMMEQAANLRRNDPATTEKYTKSITALRKQIEELKKQ